MGGQVTKTQLLVVALVASVVGAGVGVAVSLFASRGEGDPRPIGSDRREVQLETSTEGWATLGVTSSDRDELLEVPLLWTDQARVCWDISGDLEELTINILGDEVSETVRTMKAENDCKYFVPTISHAVAADCATVAASAIGDVEWALVVQQEKGDTYGLSGINSTHQLSLLDNPCSGEPYPVPPDLVDCEDGTYAKTQSDCTWAERQFARYHPDADPEWLCDPAVGQCSHPGGSVVPEGHQRAGSYCDRSACYLDY